MTVETASPVDNASAQARDRAHVFHSWSAQRLITPIPEARAQGTFFWDNEGKR